MDYDRFICEVSKNRECNLLRELSRITAEGSPSQISFGGGLPNASTFPFESMRIKGKDGFDITLEGKDLGAALQYGASQGLLELRQWLMRVQKRYHAPPLLKEDKLELIVTVGSQDGLSKAFQMLLSPGDNVLVEELLFPGTLAVIAQLYNLIIIEDDPYFFLRFSKEKIPSYQSMDTDGRVIRGDSMSKVVSAGLRLGWITGAKPLIERIFMDQQSNVMHTSTLSQILVLNLFEHWQLDGFENHVKSIQLFYQSQRDMMLASANKWLTGIAEWNVPLSGMYLWVRLPTLTDTRKQLFQQALNNAVIIVPGEAFMVKDDGPSQYCRLSYSNVTPEQIDQGMQRLAEVIHEESK